MALNPRTRSGKEVGQPGFRGEIFQTNLPGYRTNEDRINRTNTTLNLNDHDVLNIKYGMDPRLPVLFRYGFAYGYNQIVIPKGRIVAADPNLMVFDTDTLHSFNAITLANGGVNVELDTDGKTWKKTEKTLTVDTTTGYMLADGTLSMDVRPANKPLGIMERNEYTRDDDAFNGMMVSPIRTDALVELPVFASKDKAEGNPWGSIYGEDIKPGTLVKSDENGRVVPSPLNEGHAQYEEVMGDIKKYEKERQQLIGEIYSTDFSLLPEGAARFAQWAIEDRMNWNDINPNIWPNTNRRGEDVVYNPPTMYQSNYQYPGYPYDRTSMTHDLHMLASSREGLFNPRFDEKHRLDRGIPGLTDGYNAVTQKYGFDSSNKPALKIARIMRTEEVSGQEIMFTLPDTNLESASIKMDDEDVSLVAGAELAGFTVKYCDLHKGIFTLVQKDAASRAKSAKPAGEVEIFVGYEKRGLAGVPTNLDWDGCKGTAKVLLQK